MLATAAAVAQHLIIPTGRNHGFPTAVVFLVAAVLLLPPQLVALTAVAQHLPELVRNRFPRYITAFNAANYTLSALAAWGVARLVHGTGLGQDAEWALAGIAAAVTLVAVNQATLAAMLRLARGRSLRESGLLAPGALLADLALAGLGVVLARFWLSNPYLIPLALAPLALIQRSFALLARVGETEERFRALFEEAPIGTAIVGLDGRIVSSNRTLEGLLGYVKDDLSGRELDALVAPAGFSEPLGELLAGDRRRLAAEATLLGSDGSPVLARVVASAVLDAQARTRFAIVMVEDLTERMQLEEQLRHSQRMEAVGQLAGGIAHDFNNLLTIIAGRTRFALRALAGANGTLRTDLEEVAAAADRAAALTRQLLAFSRRQVLKPRIVDVNAVVTGMERMLRRLIGEDVEIELELAPDLARVLADQGQLEQVVVNLAVNARDAMPDGGRLTIRTANVDVDGSLPAAGDRAPVAGPHVMLAVADTGHGMDEETRAQVFDPFFTTKEPGKGTGLGLATVYGIVAQSDGYVRVESALGVGSTFSVYLPAVLEEVLVEDEPLPAAGTMTGSETILLAEDDDGVRALAELVLRRYGYDVLPAPDGAEALRIAERHEGTIDLLVTDLVMPGMKGPELAEELVRRRPSVHVLYMSGYADSSELPEQLPSAVVPKPFSEETLVRMVRDSLDASGAVQAHSVLPSARRRDA